MERAGSAADGSWVAGGGVLRTSLQLSVRNVCPGAVWAEAFHSEPEHLVNPEVSCSTSRRHCWLVSKVLSAQKLT